VISSLLKIIYPNNLYFSNKKYALGVDVAASECLKIEKNVQHLARIKYMKFGKWGSQMGPNSINILLSIKKLCNKTYTYKNNSKYCN